MNYKVVWPETTIFWGAGATVSIGIPTTAQMGDAIYTLATGNTPLGDRVRLTKRFIGAEKELTDYLCMLGDALKSHYAEMSASEWSAASELFNDFSKDKVRSQVVHLRTIYDWDALRRLASKAPFENNDGATYLNDLYNIIDGGLYGHMGVQVFGYKDDHSDLIVLEPRRLAGARCLLNILLQLMIACAYMQGRKDPTILQPYINFASCLADLMIEEGKHFSTQTIDNKNVLIDRRFYLFSYAIISMNFDPILLWLIFNAHKKRNDNPILLGNDNRIMKLFHDFSHFLGVRQVDGKTPDVWYPFNETVAQRINGYKNGRIGRIGKYYFPHGSTNFRECMNCGKLTATLGDEWNNLSHTLFPAPPFGTNLFSPTPRSKAEWKDIKEHKRHDAIQCPFCENMTYSTNIPMVIQSSFKGHHPSFIEEMQRDLKVCLSHTKHVVLMGYSLPKEDIIWRSVLSAKRNRNQGKNKDNNNGFCSVVVGNKGPSEWLEGKILNHWLSQIKNSHHYSEWHGYGVSTIEAAQAIFGNDRVRAFTFGIPEVWSGGKLAVKNLLYPKQIFPEGFPITRKVSSKYE